jgi:hypothetical protein
MARIFCPADVEFARGGTVALVSAGAGVLLSGALMADPGVESMGFAQIFIGILMAGYTVLAERAVQRRQAIPRADGE